VSRGKTRRRTERQGAARVYRHRQYGPRQAEELVEIDTVLQTRPELVTAVAADIATTMPGEQTMTAEQCLRAFIIKDMNGYDYAVLANKLADSRSYEAFCLTDAVHAGPRSRQTLEVYLERLSNETIEKIHAALSQRDEKKT